jgi:hypothetical protein
VSAVDIPQEHAATRTLVPIFTPPGPNQRILVRFEVIKLNYEQVGRSVRAVTRFGPA